MLPREGMRLRMAASEHDQKDGGHLWLAAGDDEHGSIKAIPNGTLGTLRKVTKELLEQQGIDEAPMHYDSFNIEWDGIRPRRGYYFAISPDKHLPSWLEVVSQ